MKFRLKILKEHNEVFSYSASFLIHALIFVSIFSALNIYDNKMKINSSFVQVLSQDLNLNSNNLEKTKKTNIKPIERIASNNDKVFESKIDLKSKDRIVNINNEFYNFSNTDADTAGLDQVYHESTLNVTLKYPIGWTFIDQDVKSKLDGVTFWSTIGNSSPPPYIHLEVKDKDLFSASRYKYKTQMSGYIIYYNDPEKLEGQISQTLYIRTNSDQDFSFKLIMEGEDAFKTFQPIFFGMIKSFKFGSSFF